MAYRAFSNDFLNISSPECNSTPNDSPNSFNNGRISLGRALANVKINDDTYENEAEIQGDNCEEDALPEEEGDIPETQSRKEFNFLSSNGEYDTEEKLKLLLSSV